MAACLVTDCVALPVRGSKTCQLHATARTAVSLRIHKMQNKPGGERCVLCRRFFVASDWVQEQRIEMTKRGQMSYGHRHVACDPPPVRRLTGKKLRESEKPLLLDL